MQLRGILYLNLGNNYQYLEPVGGSLPKFLNDDTKNENVPIHNKFSLLCSAQAYPVPDFRYILVIYLTPLLFKEAVGSSAPKFTTSSVSLGSFIVASSKSHCLACPAQGSPKPEFRYVSVNKVYLGIFPKKSFW